MTKEELKQRLIELLNETFAEQYDKRGLLTAPHTAEALIANGVTIRERGEWVKIGLGISERVVCSQCGSERGSFLRPPFCNQYGADMRGGKDAIFE